MQLSIDFDRILTSEGTDTLILAYTSKTGQSVEHYIDTDNFYFNFFCHCQKEELFWHFIGLIS